jgi:hypothetical protein
VRQRAISLLSFLPLSVFATYAFWTGPPDDRRWVDAYLLSAALAVVALALALAGREPANRLMLGANAYLVAGGLAALTRQWRVLALFGVLQESAIFVSMLVVGIVATTWSASGYIGVVSHDARRVRRYSVYLLACTAASTGVALAFQGSRLAAAALPIVMLVMAHRSLAERLRAPGGIAEAREADTLETVLRIPLAILSGAMAVRAIAAIEPYGWGWAMALGVAALGAATGGWLGTSVLRRLRRR